MTTTPTLRVTLTKASTTGAPAVQSAKPAVSAAQLRATAVPATFAAATAVLKPVVAAVRAGKMVKLQSIPPVYTQVSPAYFYGANQLAYTKSPNDSLKQSVQTFTPYEQLTSITNDTPEVIMLSSFLPFFDSETKISPVTIDLQKYMTPAAKFFDVQSQIRELRTQNIYKVGQTIYSRLYEILTQKKSDFQNAMSDLTSATTFLLSLLQHLETLKTTFDMRHEVHTVKTSDVAGLIISKYVGNASQLAQNQAVRNALDKINSQFDVNDLLATIGFSPYNLLQNYSSTKMWLQLLYEFKQILTTHSILLLDSNNQEYANDASPVVLTKPSIVRFNINPGISIFNIDSMVNSDPAQLNIVIDSLMNSYALLYDQAQFNTYEIKIAALAVFVSREFRYSRACGTADFQRLLSNTYGYTVQTTGNQQMFDSIIGSFGSDIADIAATQTNSLVDLSQAYIPNSSSVVLTFENKYIIGDNGATTPGAEYYVDSILQNGFSFNTVPLQTLANKLTAQATGFSKLIVPLDLLMLTDTTNVDQGLTNPRLLFEDIAKDLVDITTGITKPAIQSDNLSVIFIAANHAGNSGQRLRGLLFMLVMCRGMQSIQPNAVQHVDALINMIIDQFRLVDGNNDFFAQSTGISTNETELRNLLSGQSSPLMNFLINQMVKIHFSFRNNDLGYSSSRTRYGGYPDTVVMMVAFDLLLLSLWRLGGQDYEGVFTQAGVTRYGILRSNSNQTTVINNIDARLDREVSLTKQCVFALSNTLQRLRDGSVNVLNYVNSQTTRAQAQAITNTIADKTLLNILSNRQQIMMLNSSIADFNARLTQLGVTSNVKSFSATGEKTFDSADLFTVLDDGVVAPKLRNSIQGFLTDPAYLAKKGLNKKIMSVGIPVGFTEDLKKKAISIYGANASTFSDKQSDIVNICVYKIDLRHQDVTFLPQKYIVELSRFPVRVDGNQPVFSSLVDYVNKFPTRDYTQVFDTQGSASDTQFLVPTANQTKAFDDPRYSYLTDAQKQQIIQNTVISFLMETYIRLMSGVSVAEHEFSMVPLEVTIAPDLAQALVDASMQAVVDTNNTPQTTGKKGIFFTNTSTKTTATPALGLAKKVSTVQAMATTPSANPAPSSSAIKATSVASSALTAAVVPVTGNAAASVSKLTANSIGLAVQKIASLAEFSKMVSTLSDGLLVSKRLLAPKKFERVYNVIFDPDDFIVDEVKTTSTPQGKDALAQLIASGDIIVNADGTKTARDTTSGDIQINKYFITVETTEPVVNNPRPPNTPTPAQQVAAADKAALLARHRAL